MTERKTVSFEKKHVNLTVGVIISATIAVMVAAFSWGMKVENYKLAVTKLQEDLKELKEEDMSNLRAQVEKLRNLEINATLKSIDQRLESIEKSAVLKASRWYEGERMIERENPNVNPD